jgi:hypothetical protein
MNAWLRELDRIDLSRSTTRYLGIIATAGPCGWVVKAAAARLGRPAGRASETRSLTTVEEAGGPETESPVGLRVARFRRSLPVPNRAS